MVRDPPINSFKKEVGYEEEEEEEEVGAPPPPQSSLADFGFTSSSNKKAVINAWGGSGGRGRGGDAIPTPVVLQVRCGKITSFLFSAFLVFFCCLIISSFFHLPFYPLQSSYLLFFGLVRIAENGAKSAESE